MKALTLYQPWATLIAMGFKEVETRDWYTAYRGPMAIHAGMKRDVDGQVLWLGITGAKDVVDTVDRFQLFHTLPFGAVVATCNLVACLPTGIHKRSGFDVTHRDVALQSFHFTPSLGWDVEERFGNYAPGRWAWILRDVVPVNPPIPCHGWQKLWTLQGAPLAELQGRAA
jgi:hypothetical protein